MGLRLYHTHQFGHLVDGRDLWEPAHAIAVGPVGSMGRSARFTALSFNISTDAAPKQPTHDDTWRVAGLPSPSDSALERAFLLSNNHPEHIPAVVAQTG